MSQANTEFDPSQLPYNDPKTSRKVAVVTGSNSGIGLYTALNLYQHGYVVYLACRNEQLAVEAISWIQSTTEEASVSVNSLGSLKFLHIDLASFESVITAAQHLTQVESSGIDVLVNNAGVMAIPVRWSADGYDMTYQVNFYSPLLLQLHLIPLLAKKPQSRVVYVSSEAHRMIGSTSTSLADIHDHWPVVYSSMIRYGVAKVAMMQVLNVLSKKYPDIMMVSVHPGVVSTNLIASGGYWSEHYIWGAVLQALAYIGSLTDGAPLDKGCYPSIYCALTPIQNLTTGGYYKGYKHPGKASTSLKATDKQLSEEQWESALKEFEQKKVWSETV